MDVGDAVGHPGGGNRGVVLDHRVEAELPTTIPTVSSGWPSRTCSAALSSTSARVRFRGEPSLPCPAPRLTTVGYPAIDAGYWRPAQWMNYIGGTGPVGP
jgi:hypothetical protein